MTWPLTEDGLSKIANHKYVGGAYTPLDNILNPFWFWATEQLPLWIAPNLVTLTGTCHLLVAFVLLLVHCPNFLPEEAANTPNWVFVVSAYMFWAYQTLDAMDGKQARRTGASTPLGQLFDHGCDALGTIAMCSAAMSFLVVGPSRINIAGGLGLHVSFFLAQWQEYHTGVLCTSFGPVGVTEIQYTLMAILVAPVFFGGDVMAGAAPLPGSVVEALRAFDVLQILPAEGALTKGQFVILLWLAFIAVMMCISFYQTLAKAGAKSGGALLQLVPVLGTALCALLLPVSILEQHFRVVQLGVGLLIVHLTNQMIVFSMAHQPYPLFQPACLLLGLCTALGHQDVMGTASKPTGVVCLALVWAPFLLTLVMYVSWVQAAIAQICTRLNIRCFTIIPKQQKQQ